MAEETSDDGEGLLEPLNAMVERESECSILGLVPPRPEPQDQPAAADLVDGGRLLGQDGRVVERDAGHERPEIDSLGDAGGGGPGRPGLPPAPPPAGGGGE